MVDQLVLGLEGLVLPGTLLPVAGMVGLLGSPDMVDSQVGDDVVEGGEDLATDLARVPVHPLAGHLLVAVHVLVSERLE